MIEGEQSLLRDINSAVKRLGLKRVYENIISGPPLCPVCGADKAFQERNGIAHCFACGQGGGILTIASLYFVDSSPCAILDTVQCSIRSVSAEDSGMNNSA